jgi:hypothetical protein
MKRRPSEYSFNNTHDLCIAIHDIHSGFGKPMFINAIEEWTRRLRNFSSPEAEEIECAKEFIWFCCLVWSIWHDNWSSDMLH